MTTAGAGIPTGRGARPLSVRFFLRPPEIVARDLIGCLLLVGRGGRRVGGMIVETEAYGGVEDPASHAYAFRRYAGNASLYLPAATWYVYRSYGLHWCANLTCGGIPGSAVLLRAIEPLVGLRVMRRRRGAVVDALLANGPGKLCQALGIDRGFDGVRMPASRAVVLPRRGRPAVEVSRRIGITRAADRPMRFVLAGTRWASTPTAPRSR